MSARATLAKAPSVDLSNLDLSTVVKASSVDFKADTLKAEALKADTLKVETSKADALSDVKIKSIKMGTIYAHAVESGVKIGWSTDYKKRLRTYMSHGDIIRELATCNAAIEFDQLIKKALINLGRQVKIVGQESTEVYSLTHAQAVEILNYLGSKKTITPQIIANIIMPESIWSIEKISLADIKKQYGSQMIPFKFQRDPTIKHTEEIRDYIITCYMEPWFRIPEITLCKHDQVYEILDGNHRCIAISQIPEDHPALSLMINCARASYLTEAEKIRVFRDLNKSKPMPDIYVKDNYCTYYVDKVITALVTKYGEVIREKPKIAGAVPFVDRIRQFITSENIITLINSGDIDGIGYRELYNYIIHVNDMVLSVYNFAAADGKDSGKESNKAEYIAICEINGAAYPIRDFTEAITDINRTINKKIKSKFMLNLVPKTRIIDIKARIEANYEF